MTDPRSPDLAALLVGIEYCCALEGPFWRKIRGKGLAYSYGLSNNLEQGTIQFTLFKATNPVAAYNMAKEIISNLCAEASESAKPKADTGKAEPDGELCKFTVK